MFFKAIYRNNLSKNIVLQLLIYKNVSKQQVLKKMINDAILIHSIV